MPWSFGSSFNHIAQSITLYLVLDILSHTRSVESRTYGQFHPRHAWMLSCNKKSISDHLSLGITNLHSSSTSLPVQNLYQREHKSLTTGGLFERFTIDDSIVQIYYAFLTDKAI